MGVSSFIEAAKKSLNSEQFQAVAQTDGPLLILAGAGSGKTRVLTSRIAHLIHDKKVPLHQILAMTFSNKAAREMHDRVKKLLRDESPVRYPWISTFHSVCVRILRRFGSAIDVSSSFAIYDSNDQIDLVKRAFKKLNLSDKAFAPKAVHAKISNWKNEAKLPHQVTVAMAGHFDEVARDVYMEYQKQLKEAAALDFDDLLLYCLKLFQESAEVKEFFHRQWQYIMVDEFQDTNKIQYALLKEFLNENNNICVVGDDDQSIYGWRGAKVENILNFDREFENCKVVKLEQNYRSTDTILKAAASVIKNNDFRHEKTLWTDKGAGQLISVSSFNDDRDEVRFIIRKIKQAVREGTPPTEIAVLYRINYVSRSFEEECLRQGLPYKIVGGFRFYERKEIKDILSYVRLLMNPADRVAFRRSVNEPARGIGKKSVEKLEEAASLSSKDILRYILEEDDLPVTGKAKKGIASYQSVLRWGHGVIDNEGSMTDLFVGVMEDSGYLETLRKDTSEEAREREANLQELLSAVQEFEESWSIEETSSSAEEEMSDTRRKLFDFLERVALIADVDQLDDRSVEQVTFMSLHAAKGLEFELCFITALEDGIFPSLRSLDSPDQLEEERRLLYVGITRAKSKLYLTRSESRRTYGQINFQMPSRFFDEIDSSVLSLDEGTGRKAPRFMKPKSKSYEDFSQEDDHYEFEQDIDCFSYNRGDRVKHPSFGDGVVKKIETIGADECLTIDFSQRGRKRVLSQYVKRAV